MAMISRRIVIAAPVLLVFSGCVNHAQTVKQEGAPVAVAAPTAVRMAPVPTADWKALVVPEPTSAMNAPVEKTKWAKQAALDNSKLNDDDGSLLTFQTSPEEKQYLIYVGKMYDLYMSSADIPENGTLSDLQSKIRQVARDMVAAKPKQIPPEFATMDADLDNLAESEKSAGKSGLSEDEVFDYLGKAKTYLVKANDKIGPIKARWLQTRRRVKP